MPLTTTTRENDGYYYSGRKYAEKHNGSMKKQVWYLNEEEEHVALLEQSLSRAISTVLPASIYDSLKESKRNGIDPATSPRLADRFAGDKHNRRLKKYDYDEEQDRLVIYKQPGVRFNVAKPSMIIEGVKEYYQYLKNRTKKNGTIGLMNIVSFLKEVKKYDISKHLLGKFYTQVSTVALREAFKEKVRSPPPGSKKSKKERPGLDKDESYKNLETLLKMNRQKVGDESKLFVLSLITFLCLLINLVAFSIFFSFISYWDR
jgi:hypothetical protein